MRAVKKRAENVRARLEPKKRKTGELKEQHLKVRVTNNFEQASNVTKELVAYLAERFPPDLIAGKIEELLHATHKTRGGNDIPDNRAREAAVKLLISYLVGLPVQRTENVNINIDSMEDLQSRMKGSPAVQAALNGLISVIPDENTK